MLNKSKKYFIFDFIKNLIKKFKNKIMKKFIFAIAMVATVFVGCGSDDEGGSDDSSDDTCVECEFTVAGTTTITEICDNGDGTLDLTNTANGISSTITQDIPGDFSFDEYAATLTTACNQ